jgi:tetratricopeptide (TPR) repeat protein
MNTIRKLVRKKRIDQRMSQADLADGIREVNQSTISRFERGLSELEPDQIDLILDKLHINRNDIPYLVEEIEHQERVSFFSLRALEALIRKNIFDRDKFQELSSFIGNENAVLYAKAKRHYIKKELDKAKRKYLKIVNSNEDDQFLNENLISGSYLNLSAIAYLQNDLALGFRYCDLGLENFDPSGERRYLKYSLIYNKALFFFKLGDMDQAEKTLEPAWQDRLQINDDMRTRIQVYSLKASIKRERKLHDESIRILNKAVDLAAINDLSDMSFELSIELAKHCYENKHYQLSETCFKSALLFREDLDNPNDASVFIEIARLYFTTERYRQAEIEAQKAIAAAKQHNDMYKLTRALMVQGEIDTRIGSTACPRSSFKSALALAQEYGFKQLEYEILNRLIQLDPSPQQQNDFVIQRDLLEAQMRGGTAI